MIMMMFMMIMTMMSMPEIGKIANLTLLPDLRSALREPDLDLYDKAIIAREKQDSLTSARKLLAPDTLSLASYDSADIPVTRDKHKRTMFSKPATLIKVPTQMEPLDFTTDKNHSAGDHNSAFTLRKKPSLKSIDARLKQVWRRTPGQRYRGHDVWDTSRFPEATSQAAHQSRVKSEEPSDDSGVEISGHAHVSGQPNTGHLGQPTSVEDTPRTRERFNTMTRPPRQQFITHVAEVHHRAGSDQQSDGPTHYSKINTNNFPASHHHHHQQRRERQRLWARRQDDSTTTDEDVATRTFSHQRQVQNGISHSRQRSASRESRNGSRTRPRSRSASSSRQPVSRSRGESQDRLFLTVPAEYPRKSQVERGRTPTRHGDSDQRSSSSSVSPQNRSYYISQQHHHHDHQKQQQFHHQTGSRREKTSWHIPRQRQDSYNTDTSTTESTIGRRGNSESSARTESTLTVNGKPMPSVNSPQVVIEDTLDSPPNRQHLNTGRANSGMYSRAHYQNHNAQFEERPSRSRSKSPRSAKSGRISRSRSPQIQRKVRPTAESLFYNDDSQFINQTSVKHSEKDKLDIRNNKEHRQTSLLQPKRMSSLFSSPKRTFSENNRSMESERIGKRGSVEEVKSITGKNSSMLKSGSNRSQASGNIPLIQINSQMMPRAASEAGKMVARVPTASQSVDSDSPVYAQPIKLKDRVTISDTPTQINSSEDNAEEESDTGSLASTITSHKHVTSISVGAPSTSASAMSRLPSGVSSFDKVTIIPSHKQ
ncbi:hypothetical protein ElyMa_001269500 [Elysia marginata]|uniref:Uncharacterized protein n=1 Tax=Elysia marginata TaxID=1093978 RepID=A0AAV4IHU4_9GAST|nr:hypothetical protein ElyMa_001269500 [Elysia marginata]